MEHLKYLTKLERLVRDKGCSLLRNFVNYDRKKFYKIGPQASEAPAAAFFMLRLEAKQPSSKGLYYKTFTDVKHSGSQ